MVENLSEKAMQLEELRGERIKRFYIDMAVSFGAIAPVIAITVSGNNNPENIPFVVGCAALRVTSWAVALRHPLEMILDLGDFYESLESRSH